MTNPAIREWDIKQRIADFVRGHEACSFIDIVHNCEEYTYNEIAKAVIQLQFIGIIEERPEDEYHYIKEENYYGVRKYNKKQN